jgi:hypothetical protein
VSGVRESSARTGDSDRHVAERVELELPAEHSFNAVGRLVVGGLASRLDFPVAEIEDLQLAVEALLCRPAAEATLTVSIEPSVRGLEARLGPFAAGGERGSVERMLLRLVEDAVVQDSGEGEWIVIGAPRQRAAARGSS